MRSHNQLAKHLPFMFSLLVATAAAGCGDIPEDTDEEQSALSLIFSARVRADLTANFDPGCCGATFKAVPTGTPRFETINDTTCNNATDYLVAPVLGTNPAWAAASFDVDLSGIPNGRPINGITFGLCAKPLVPGVPGYIAAKAIYWDGTTPPPGNRYIQTVRNGFPVDNIMIPANLFPSWQSYTSGTVATTNPAPSSTGKTSSSRMRLNLFGNGVQLSQVRVNISYPTVTPPPL
jgi:hypothetical protein